MDMVALVLLVVAAGVGFMIFRANKLGGPEAMAGQISGPGKRARFSDDPEIPDMEPGAVYGLRAFGDDMEDLDVQVIARHIYSEGDFEWYEFEGEAGDRKVWLTVEHDDEVEMSVTLRKPRLDDLGLTKKKLNKMDDKESGSFTFEGTEYVYDDSDEAVFHRNGDRSKREVFYYWEFEARDGKSAITVERWEDGSFECHVSQPIRPSQIDIFSSKGA